MKVCLSMTDIPYNGVSTVNLSCNTATEILFQDGGQGDCRERGMSFLSGLWI